MLYKQSYRYFLRWKFFRESDHSTNSVLLKTVFSCCNFPSRTCLTLHCLYNAEVHLYIRYGVSSDTVLGSEQTFVDFRIKKRNGGSFPWIHYLNRGTKMLNAKLHMILCNFVIVDVFLYSYIILTFCSVTYIDRISPVKRRKCTNSEKKDENDMQLTLHILKLKEV